MSYTGAVGQLVKSTQKTLILNGGESKCMDMMLQQDLTYFSLSLSYVATNIELEIEDVDYLRILEGGNFIHFVAIAYNAADKLSVVKTANYRLRVSP